MSDVEIELTGEVGEALERCIDEALAAEREACATIADAVAITWSLGSSISAQQTAKTCRDIAELIRRRGDQ